MKTVGLIIVSFLGFLSTESIAQGEAKVGGLVVRGKVTDLYVDRSRKDSISFDVRLEMEFKNESERPIILFRPNTNNSYFEDRYYLGGKSLSVNEKGESIFGYGAWESIMGSDFYRRLAEELDTKVPTDENTKILQPNEVWQFADKTTIVFSSEEERGIFPKRRSWNEMQEFPSKLWLTVNYELNPWNVEYFKPNLIRKLKKRWKNLGDVLIEEDKDSRFSHLTVSSGPMLIDFSSAREVANGDKY